MSQHLQAAALNITRDSENALHIASLQTGPRVRRQAPSRSTGWIELRSAVELFPSLLTLLALWVCFSVTVLAAIRLLG